MLFTTIDLITKEPIRFKKVLQSTYHYGSSDPTIRRVKFLVKGLVEEFIPSVDVISELKSASLIDPGGPKN
jgi:hypothetical protein